MRKENGSRVHGPHPRLGSRQRARRVALAIVRSAGKRCSPCTSPPRSPSQAGRCAKWTWRVRT
jgi:hypothetical protein